MRLGSIKPGDIVQADVRGVVFYGHADRIEGSELLVTPLTRNVTYRRLSARQVIAHWRKAAGSKPRWNGSSSADDDS